MLQNLDRLKIFYYVFDRKSVMRAAQDLHVSQSAVSQSLAKLENEIKYIENYLALEKLRQKEDVKIEFNVDGDPGDLIISPLLFTPFLENAFKHGINKVLENACVKINLKVSTNNIHFIVENSKPEFKTDDFKKKQGGIGLANVKKRLQILYPENSRLDIENTKHTYKIELFLTLK